MCWCCCCSGCASGVAVCYCGNGTAATGRATGHRPSLWWFTPHAAPCRPRLSPAAAGLEPDGTPYLCGMDSIGAQETAKDFMVAGTATDSLLGICESLWRPDLVRAAACPPARPPAWHAARACTGMQQAS
jgi:hypothetical protein